MKKCPVCEAPVATHPKGDIMVTMLDGRVVTFLNYIKLRDERDLNEKKR